VCISINLSQIFHFAGHSEAVSSVDISPDGKVVASGGWDDSLRVWSLTTDHQYDVVSVSASVEAVGFRPDPREHVEKGTPSTMVRYNHAVNCSDCGSRLLFSLTRSSLIRRSARKRSLA
jgi:WD40 repeat protein